MVTAEFHQYRIECKYIGENPSPLNPKCYHDHGLTITNKSNTYFTTVPVWEKDGPIMTRKQVLAAFARVINAAVIGLLDPRDFVEYTGLNPDLPRTELIFTQARDMTLKLDKVVAENQLHLLASLKSTGVLS